MMNIFYSLAKIAKYNLTGKIQQKMIQQKLKTIKYLPIWKCSYVLILLKDNVRVTNTPHSN